MPGIWPDFTPLSGGNSARVLLDQIMALCVDGFAQGPAAGDPRFMQIRQSAMKDQTLVDHGRMTDFINIPGGPGVPGTGRPSVNDPIPGELKLEAAWTDLMACRSELLPPMLDFIHAVEHIDHLGGTGSRVPGPPTPIPVVTGKWPDIRVGGRGNEGKTARTLLGGIAVICLGESHFVSMDEKRRSLLEELAAIATLDRLNVAHDGLRNFVTAGGTEVSTGSMTPALKHVRDAYAMLEKAFMPKGTGVDAAIAAAAIAAVRHGTTPPPPIPVPLKSGGPKPPKMSSPQAKAKPGPKSAPKSPRKKLA